MAQYIYGRNVVVSRLKESKDIDEVYIADSFKESEKEVVDKSEYDALMEETKKLKTDYDDLRNKYISRFSSVSSQEKNEVTKPEELKETKVIDVRSIF